ncbi:hypothetical protein, partial [Propionicicella superfundia]|uniref:hypothetical protein n=1 Tax=Propionicicella superfundia TaxID=348582 RepID=UPI00055DAED6
MNHPGRIVRTAVVLLAVLLAGFGTAPAASATGERVTSDGAAYTVPDTWTAGENLTISGTGWTN